MRTWHLMSDLLEDQNMLQLLIDCTKFDFIPLNKGNNKITELRTILQRESPNS
jgi:hypothetical protein